MWSESVTIELEIKEIYESMKFEIKVEFWRMQRPGVALVHEFKANDKSEEIKMHELSVKKEIKMDELSVMKFKSEAEIEEIKNGWIKYDGESWIYEAEGDKN